MLLAEILTERLARSFIPAKYGYWIADDGRIHNVNIHQGHPLFLAHAFPGEDFDDMGENLHLYDIAMEKGWIRIVAEEGNDEMAVQYFKLTRRTAQSLIDLILGLEPKIFYYFDDIGGHLHTPEDAARHVRQTLDRYKS